MHVLTPGHWYLLFLCKSCQTKQILFPDLTKGQARLNATYSTDCPACGHHASYDSEHIERYYHPEQAKQAVA